MTPLLHLTTALQSQQLAARACCDVTSLCLVLLVSDRQDGPCLQPGAPGQEPRQEPGTGEHIGTNLAPFHIVTNMTRYTLER